MRGDVNIVVNETHSRQDIRQERQFDAGRRRYSFARALLEPPSGRARLIDVGGGAGEFTHIAREAGYSTTLIDGNESSVEREKQRQSDAVVQNLTAGLPDIPDNGFDAAICLEVIEHIVTAENLIASMYRVIKPGGYLVLSTPNFSFLMDRLKYMRGGLVKEEGYHFRFYTIKSLTGICQDAGFIIEQRRSMASAMGVNLVLRLLTLGRIHIHPFASPKCIESWAARTFVWKLRKPS